MYASYHNHTPLCRHATGSPREYVEEAIHGGFSVLGFSDHTPYFYDGDYYPTGVKMRPEEMDTYVDTILALKKEYASDIRIHLGLEIEYYPKYFGRLMEFLSQYPFEYFLLGQHNLGNEIREDGTQDYSAFRKTNDERQLARYVDQCIEGLETGYFDCFAHPDVIHFIGDTALFEKHMRRLARRSKELDIPLEINLQGLIEGRHYPNMDFWPIAGEIGNEVIFGADAHKLGRICDRAAIRLAEEMAAKYHLNVIGDLENRIAGKSSNGLQNAAAESIS